MRRKMKMFYLLSVGTHDGGCCRWLFNNEPYRAWHPLWWRITPSNQRCFHFQNHWILLMRNSVQMYTDPTHQLLSLQLTGSRQRFGHSLTHWSTVRAGIWTGIFLFLILIFKAPNHSRLGSICLQNQKKEEISELKLSPEFPFLFCRES